jgi:pimeloyl-ACP methyl ester carboxylesterase
MRGYAPTDLAPDGAYQLGALVQDANEIHEALGGDDRAVLIGHDWGAVAAYMAGWLREQRRASSQGPPYRPAGWLPTALPGKSRYMRSKDAPGQRRSSTQNMMS